MKKAIMIIVFISLNATAKDSAETAQETIKKSGDIMLGLVKRVEALENRKYSIVCTTTTAIKNNSGNNNAIITANIPENYLERSFVVTGGGCQVIKEQTGATSPISENHISANGKGWFCKTQFTYGHAIAKKITAFVNYCHIVVSD